MGRWAAQRAGLGWCRPKSSMAAAARYLQVATCDASQAQQQCSHKFAQLAGKFMHQARLLNAHLWVDVSHVARRLLVAVLGVHANQVGAGRRRNASTRHRHGCCRCPLAPGAPAPAARAVTDASCRPAAGKGGGGGGRSSEVAGGGSGSAAPYACLTRNQASTTSADSGKGLLTCKERQAGAMGSGCCCKDLRSLLPPAQTVGRRSPRQTAPPRWSRLGAAVQRCPARFYTSWTGDPTDAGPAGRIAACMGPVLCAARSRRQKLAGHGCMLHLGASPEH